eukprot:scaffold42373_cov14-Tisochrysis_lutea.AAC.1
MTCTHTKCYSLEGLARVCAAVMWQLMTHLKSPWNACNGSHQQAASRGESVKGSATGQAI